MSRAWSGGSTRAWRKLRTEKGVPGAPCETKGPTCKERSDTLGHKIPRRLGGQDTPDNTFPECGPCNYGHWYDKLHGVDSPKSTEIPDWLQEELG